jgi:hypothetical protein
MIIVKLTGGLGNQMFQYAAARRLSVKHGSLLKLDDSIYRTDQAGLTPYKYELGCFSLGSKMANKMDIILAGIGGGPVSMIMQLLPFNKKLKMIREKDFNFDPAMPEVPDNIYLIGHWISYKYFRDIEDLIRKEFTFIVPQTGGRKQLSYHIASSESVSLHIRRGDYVADKSTNQKHGVCGPDYYKKAISIIEEKTGSPHFYVFSDDIKWAKENVKISHPTEYVENNINDNASEDMRLMSQCKHNIIANSTYSWWGAWLNSNPGKTVLTPKKWFNDESINVADLIPEGWIKI